MYIAVVDYMQFLFNVEDKFLFDIQSVRLEHVLDSASVLYIERDTGENSIAIACTGAVTAAYNSNLDVATLCYRKSTDITLFCITLFCKEKIRLFIPCYRWGYLNRTAVV